MNEKSKFCVTVVTQVVSTILIQVLNNMEPNIIDCQITWVKIEICQTKSFYLHEKIQFCITSFFFAQLKVKFCMSKKENLTWWHKVLSTLFDFPFKNIFSKKNSLESWRLGHANF
jgi:hypothetical protein